MRGSFCWLGGGAPPPAESHLDRLQVKESRCSFSCPLKLFFFKFFYLFIPDAREIFGHARVPSRPGPFLCTYLFPEHSRALFFWEELHASLRIYCWFFVRFSAATAKNNFTVRRPDEKIMRRKNLTYLSCSSSTSSNIHSCCGSTIASSWCRSASWILEQKYNNG